MSTHHILPIRDSDIPALTTILARSFHPTNPYIKATLPDTPAVREWWREIFQNCLADTRWHVLVASPAATPSGSTDEEAIGVLILRLMQPHELGSGLWTAFPRTREHDAEKYDSMVGAMSKHREAIMRVGDEVGARVHYLVELLGVDHSWKGKGIGAALLRRACEVADAEGLEVFVQANGSARAFYEKVGGFGVVAREVMPGGNGYEEFMLVRPAMRSSEGEETGS
ncbi:hypothetical protein LTR09_006962 [Extremus antarcticus]|uniref:N-acetyltransferase domain-containing protein n=1 Tax=Extremus antarcticus TaxID=702011 RepID=A0AAJ0DKB2_9PEZI|nr:hypothetical protein LTR09_006962 [Extremus antarcticus]